MRRRLRALLLAGFAALAFRTPSVDSSSEPLAEYPVKAAFLYHFVEFVEWPRTTHSEPATLTIGVLGRDPFGEVLDSAILNKMMAGRTLTIRRFATVEALETCEILFIASSEMPRLPQVLLRLRGAAVLTVGEADRFAQRGGMIGFVLENNRVRLDINRVATESAGLRVSSKLLAVARMVKPDGDGSGEPR